MAALHAYAADKRPRMRFTIARAALATSACLAADLPVQPIGHQDGSLLLQLGPPVGFHNETLSITATIRGARATRTRRMTTGVPVHFRFSNHEDSLVLLVCARDAHGRLDEPIAILEQARNPVPTRVPTRAPTPPVPPAPRRMHAMIPRSAQGQIPHGARLPPQPLMPLLNGSLSRVVVSSQDPRWTWTSHHPFDAPRRCAVERGRAYVSESEGMLLSEAEIRAILQRGVSKKRPAIVGSTMHWPIGGVPGRESCETLSPNQSGLQSCTTARTRT